MQTNPTWKDWFVFSKKERIIVVALIVLLMMYLAFRAFYRTKTEAVVIENLDEKITQLSTQSNDSSSFQNASAGMNTDLYVVPGMPPKFFYFDPNTLDAAGFTQLGLREKTVHTLINYRNKGGHFYKPDDLRKIYGLREEEANRLVPYVKISATQQNADYANKYTGSNSSAYYKPHPHIIDINTATVDQWKSLPAIGEVLSNRIVKYRDAKGGFSSVSDVKKVYGITDSTYTVILPYLSFTGKKANELTVTSTQPLVQKININKATAAELKNNPDIPSDIAEAIVIYRRQHGNYASVSDIKKIIFIHDEMYRKIAPWLTVE